MSKLCHGADGWKLTKTNCRYINGCNSRCVAAITGRSQAEEASPRTRTTGVVGILEFRRLRWLGHLLRGQRYNRTRRDVLRQASMEMEGLMKVDGGFLMSAPAYNNIEQLISMAGEYGTEEERANGRAQWRELCTRLLDDADLQRMRQRGNKKDASGMSGDATKPARMKANTQAETEVALEELDHGLRLYTDGGAAGKIVKGAKGKAAWGVHVIGVSEQGELEALADLWGPVELRKELQWHSKCERATNNTRELMGVAEALLWLLYVDETDKAAVILIDSLYAANAVRGSIKVNENGELVAWCV
eukprot:SAG11_NODE_472_length_9191_cov_5.863851_4_plen_303_part_01